MKLTSLFYAFQAFTKAFSSWILLTVVYYVGVGIPALIARLSGKRFLLKRVGHSSWKKYSRSHTIRQMY